MVLSKDDHDALLQCYVPADDIYLFNTGAAQRAYLSFGCHYVPQARAHRFMLWSPNASAVSVVGDFNDWQEGAHPMTNMGGGVYAAFIPGLHDGDLYKYAVRQYGGGVALKADPFAFHAETGPKTASKVWSLDGFSWTDRGYLGRRLDKDPHQEAVSIYEVHLGSWRTAENGYPWYRAVADELADYCRELGYTHVELLPLTEYPFDGSWGYQTSGYFAPTSRYGTPQDFMYLVDRLHRDNIGVILDWSPAHFPRDAHGLARFDGTCLFEHADPRRGEHAQWGTLVFNYGRPEVRSFLISSAMLFFDCYHIDGLRVDAVSSMLYLNYGREDGQYVRNADGSIIDQEAVQFVQQLNSTLLTAFPGCFTVAEEATDFPLVTRPPYDGGLGFSFKWDMGFMHDTLDYLALDPLFRAQQHDKLTFSLMYAFNEAFILAYSHDEVVHGKHALLDKMFGDYEQKFATLRALFGFQYGHPGKKLNFMGSEFGQFIEWNYQQQLDWLLLDYPRHKQMQAWIKALNRYYQQHPALYRVDDAWAGFHWLNVDDAERSSVAFMRRSDRTDDALVIVACNFSGQDWPQFQIALPEPGELVLDLSSNDISFGGDGQPQETTLTARPQPFRDMPYSAMICLPALSTAFYRFIPQGEN